MYVNKLLVWHKKFGPAQNFLGPVKGQGMVFYFAYTQQPACQNTFIKNIKHTNLLESIFGMCEIAVASLVIKCTSTHISTFLK